MGDEIYKRNAQLTKANHIANWAASQFPREEYLVAILAAVNMVERQRWGDICHFAGKPGSSQEVRQMTLDELRRRISATGYPTVQDWSDAKEVAQEFKGLPAE